MAKDIVHIVNWEETTGCNQNKQANFYFVESYNEDV